MLASLFCTFELKWEIQHQQIIINEFIITQSWMTHTDPMVNVWYGQYLLSGSAGTLLWCCRSGLSRSETSLPIPSGEPRCRAGTSPAEALPPKINSWLTYNTHFISRTHLKMPLSTVLHIVTNKIKSCSLNQL